MNNEERHTDFCKMIKSVDQFKWLCDMAINARMKGDDCPFLLMLDKDMTHVFFKSEKDPLCERLMSNLGKSDGVVALLESLHIAYEIVQE